MKNIVQSFVISPLLLSFSFQPISVFAISSEEKEVTKSGTIPDKYLSVDNVSNTHQ